MNLIRRKNIAGDFLIGILLSCLSLVIIQCHGGHVKDQKNSRDDNTSLSESKGYPKFEFTKEIHKFGEISEGEIPVCDFYFKNVGTRPLIISKIESNCGCTNIKWDKKPIKVGAESKITVEFDSKGRHGKQYKKLTLFCNTLEKTKELIVTAKVK